MVAGFFAAVSLFILLLAKRAHTDKSVRQSVDRWPTRPQWNQFRLRDRRQGRLCKTWVQII